MENNKVEEDSNCDFDLKVTGSKPAPLRKIKEKRGVSFVPEIDVPFKVQHFIQEHYQTILERVDGRSHLLGNKLHVHQDGSIEIQIVGGESLKIRYKDLIRRKYERARASRNQQQGTGGGGSGASVNSGDVVVLSADDALTSGSGPATAGIADNNESIVIIDDEVSETSTVPTVESNALTSGDQRLLEPNEAPCKETSEPKKAPLVVDDGKQLDEPKKGEDTLEPSAVVMAEKRVEQSKEQVVFSTIADPADGGGESLLEPLKETSGNSNKLTSMKTVNYSSNSHLTVSSSSSPSSSSLSVHSPKTPARTDDTTARQPTTTREDFDAPTELTERENTPPRTSNVIDVDRFIDSLNIQFTAEHGVMLTPEKQPLGSVAAADSSDVWEPTLTIDSTPTGPDKNFVADYDGGVTLPMDANMKSLSDGEDNVTLYICLLYTSPSPRDGLLSRMPSSA